MAEKENDRRFTGVFIPAEIYLNPELSWTEKALWCEVQALSGPGYCFANNAHFAKHLGISEVNVSKHLSKLKKLGYIEVVSFDGRTRKMKAVLSKPTKQPYQNRQPCLIDFDKALYNDEIQTEIKKENNTLVNPVGLPPAPFDDSDVVQRWNTIAEKYNLPKILALTPERKKRLIKVLKENKVTIDEYFEILNSAIRVSLFLRGIKVIYEKGESRVENKDWKSSFDFFLERGKFLKTREGNYADPDLL